MWTGGRKIKVAHYQGRVARDGNEAVTQYDKITFVKNEVGLFE